jgi:hypothetical protein
MAGAEKQMIDRLRAGPVVRAGNVTVIPILRFTSVLSAKHGAVGAILPVAVLAIAGDEVRAWRMDGHPESTQQWLETVPDLTRLIDGIRINRDVGQERKS